VLAPVTRCAIAERTGVADGIVANEDETCLNPRSRGSIRGSGGRGAGYGLLRAGLATGSLAGRVRGPDRANQRPIVAIPPTTRTVTLT
jgi:hypothetical protein